MAKKKTSKKKTKKAVENGSAASEKKGKNDQVIEVKGKNDQVIEVKVKIVEVDVKPNGTPIRFKDLPLSGAMNRRAGNWIDQEEKLVMSINDGDIVTTTKIKKLTIEKGKRSGVFDPLNFTSKQLEKISNIIKSECPVTLVLEPDTQGMFEELYGDVTESTQIDDKEDDNQPELEFDPDADPDAC